MVYWYMMHGLLVYDAWQHLHVHTAVNEKPEFLPYFEEVLLMILKLKFSNL